jgi:hypothetical protein
MNEKEDPTTDFFGEPLVWPENPIIEQKSAETELKSIRPTREEFDGTLPGMDLPPDWKAEWWGMPEFTHGDASPQYRITVNFMTLEDLKAFAERIEAPVTSKSDSCWFPHQQPLSGQYFYDGPAVPNRYPICIPSKGRADCQKTGKALDRMGLPYLFFVESEEYDEYARHLGADKVVSMPFNNLGQGSVPARNFIWEWAKERGYKRHWTVDDNITGFYRCNNNRRLCVYGGGMFKAMEDFVDRYENIAMAGPHDKGFVPDREPGLTPFLLNSRVYSCILLDTSLPDRWRGRYNEDTDLSLRLLKQGHCTLLFRTMLMDKANTVGVKNAMPMKGGNTDNVYNTGDHRLAFAQSLKDQHPDEVEVKWKFGRWHHQVDYSNFKGNKLRRKPGITPSKDNDEYEMRLMRKNEKQL